MGQLNKWHHLGAVVLGLALTASIVVFARGKPQDSHHPAQPKIQPITVEVQTVKKVTVEGAMKALGTLAPSQEVQLSFNASGHLTKINYKNDLTKKSWKKTAHMSRQCYLGNEIPGSNSSVPTSGLTSDVDNLKYTKKESEVGYKNFCVIEAFIKSIEWLYLAAKGHRRAYFNLNKKQLEKKWLIP